MAMMRESCGSDFTDAETQHVVLHSTDGDTESLDRQYVHVLLDISEQDDWRDQDKHEIQSQTGWEDAVEGWGRSPLALFLQAQRNVKRIKQNILDSHCVLCAELNLPIYCTSGSAPKPCYDISEENYRKTATASLDIVKKTYNTSSSACSDEMHSLQQKKSEPFVNKLPSGDEQRAHHKAPCLMLNEKGVGQVPLSINNFSVLPPVKESRNLKSSNLFKSMDPTDWCPAEEGVTEAPGTTGAVTAGERVGVNGEIGYQGSPTSKHWLGQYSNHLPSFNIALNKKHELTSCTVADTLPQTSYSQGPNLRQDELARPSPRNNTSYGLYSGHKVRSQGRPEFQHLMLTGTRLPIAVCFQRIL